MVIAAFNAERFVAASIRSALAQTMALLEVIVVDDCSTDGTATIVEAIAGRDARVRVERLSRNGGPARARNRGLELARGTNVAILDGDDLWASDRLERLLEVMRDAAADLVADDLVVFDDAREAPARLLIGHARPIDITLTRYLSENVLYRKGMPLGYLKPLFRLDRLRALAGRYDEELGIGEDDDLIVRMLRGGATYRLASGAGYAYRKHAASISHRLSVEHAAAMVASSRRLLDDAAGSDEAARFRHRHAAFVRAEAFARLIDALKRRRWVAASRIAASRPSALPLLRMPIAGKLGRLLPRRRNVDPHAEAALAAIMAAQ